MILQIWHDNQNVLYYLNKTLSIICLRKLNTSRDSRMGIGKVWLQARGEYELIHSIFIILDKRL